MCLGTELDLEVVVTFQTKWSSLTHPWAKHSLEGVGRPVMAEEAAPALKPGIARDRDRPTHKCGPLSRQHFTHFALTSFHLYVGPTEESSRWRRGAASNRWNGAAEADAPLFSPSVTSSSSVPSSQAAEQTPRPAVPFCPLSPDGVLRRHWRFPLPSAPSPVLSEAPGANREPERRTATPSRAGTADLRNRSGGSESQSRSGREGRSWLGLSTPPTPPPSRAAIRWPGPRLCPRRLGGRRSGPNRSAASVQGKEERDLAHFSLPIDTVIADFVERRR